MKRIAVALIVILGLLLTSSPVYATDVNVASTSGDGDWEGDTWSVDIYPNEVKSTTIELRNSSSNSLEVWVSIVPDSLDNGNLTFELDWTNLIISGKISIYLTLTVRANGSTTPGSYSAELEIKSEEAPEPAPVIGGGGGGSAPPRLVSSSDSTTVLSIPLSTTIKDKDGRRIYPSNIKITDNPNPPVPPSNTSIIGLVYNFEPSGATFNPPITLTFTYDPTELPEGVNEGDLVVAFYDEAIGEWVNLECVVDTETNTITALVSHFTSFAILVEVLVPEIVLIIPEPVEPEPEPASILPTPEPEPTLSPPASEPEPLPMPTPEPIQPFAPEPSPDLEPVSVTPWGLIGGCIIWVIATALALVWIARRYRDKRKA